MVNSRINIKQYYLPVYYIWAIIIPTLLILINAYLKSDNVSEMISVIDWKRVPSMYALYGLIYPLSYITLPGFYIAFTEVQGFTFVEAIKNIGDPINGTIAKKIIISVLLFTIVWLGPIIHLIIAAYRHKKYIETKNEETVSWVDYFYGFI